jgi:hypothetical protein
MNSCQHRLPGGRSSANSTSGDRNTNSGWNWCSDAGCSGEYGEYEHNIGSENKPRNNVFCDSDTLVKTQEVVKNRGQDGGDIKLPGYLTNESGPVPLVVDLRIAHDRVGSSDDPTLNGHI